MSGISTLIFVGAVMACVLGGITVVAHIYNLNSIKSKPLATVSTVQQGGQRKAKSARLTNTFRSRRRNGVSKR